MVAYEWTVEAEDAYGDINEVEHADSFRDALRMAKDMQGHKINICLVKDSGSRLENRNWAYVSYGILQATFHDSAKHDTGIRVPRRFIAEVQKEASK